MSVEDKKDRELLEDIYFWVTRLGWLIFLGVTFIAFKIREGKHERIVELSKFLNSNLINIDSNLKNIDFLTFKKKLSKINLKKYDFYKKNFITFKKQTNSDHTYLGIIKSIEKYG